MATTKRRPSGPSGKTQPEQARKNKSVGVRLSPEILAEMRERAELYEVGLGSVITLAWTIAEKGGALDAALAEAARWAAILEKSEGKKPR